MKNKLPLYLLLLPQLLCAQVKTDIGAAALEGAPGAAANARVNGATGGADVKLAAPSLVPLSLAPLNGTPKVVVHAAGVQALPASALPGDAGKPGLPEPEARKSLDFTIPKAQVSSEQPYFTKALAETGVPAEIAGWLGDYQKTRHPGDQDKVYHGLKHSQDVPNAAARVLEGPKAAALTRRQKVLLVVAAAFHDIDPERAPGTPARVSATLNYLDTDPESRALLAEIQRLYDITPAQIKTLIKATDFDMNAGGMAQIQTDFEQMVLEHFPAGEQTWAREWGRRLAFIDKVASYVGTVEDSDKIVRRLSMEIRASLKAATGKETLRPTEDELLGGSYRFQQAQRLSADYDYLPDDLKANYEKTLRYFQSVQSPAAPAAAPNEQARAQAPPSSSNIEKIAATVKSDPAAASQPGFFRQQTVLVIGQLRASKYTLGDNVSRIAAAQERYKKLLMEGSAAALKKEGLSPNQVASHGTTLHGFWGMLISGGIDATSSYAGFSGESAEVWAGAGIEGGASYGAKRGVYKGMPGVSIILHNKSKPMRIIGGETLDRRPTPKDDFLAVVITDGEKTIVLERKDLAALAASAERWKTSAVAKAKAGSMKEFDEFDKIRDYFDPSRRR